MKRFYPEALLLLLAVVLRATMLFNFHIENGYDFGWHWAVAIWYSTHPWQMPPLTFSVATYHPPLYYWLAGQLLHAGVTRPNLVSLVCSLGRLGLFAWGLQRYVPSRRARLAALALAAVLPASVHLDGIGSNEGLSNLLALASMLLIARVASGGGWSIAAAAGLLLGLNILTKLSALALLIAAAFAAVLALAWRRRLLPWVVLALTVTGVSGWYFVHNQRLYQAPVISAIRCGQRGWVQDAVEAFGKIPYLQRRPPEYFAGWNSDIFLVTPYRPTSVTQKPRFFSAMVASTVVDVYFFGFYAKHKTGVPYPPTIRRLSQLSAFGGTVIMILTACAWAVALVASWRRRRLDHLFLLVVPPVALLGQMHFAMIYPDPTGPVKGIYMQFAAPPLFALFGMSLAWLHGRRWGVPLALLGWASLAMVAAYTFACRFA